MIFDKDMITVRSTPHFYEREESGKKPYTARIIIKPEYDLLTVLKPKRVRVFAIDAERNEYFDFSPRHSPRSPSGIDAERNEYFDRTITSVDLLGLLLGKVLVGIAWDPSEGEK